MVNTPLRTLALLLGFAHAALSASSQSAELTQSATAEARQMTGAAPLALLTEEAPARLAPSETAAVLRVLAAGSELKPAPTPTADLSANWSAISLYGPFTLYVRNGDIDKGLAIKPASPLYLEPDNAAAVVAYAEEGDAITITGLRGRWTQIELQKTLTAYVEANAIAAKSGNASATTGSAPETEASQETTNVVETPSPTASPESASVELPKPEESAAKPELQAALTVLAEAKLEAGEPELLAIVDSEPTAQTATVALNEGEGSAGSEHGTREWRADASSSNAQTQYKPALNRSQIQGKLVSTRKRFSPRRPYDWQINAKFSFRIAYLDFSRMQGTEQLARYEGQQVIVYGLVSPLGDGQYVMLVESIRLQ